MTIFAPCALPMLPIIVGGSLKQTRKPRKRALIISASLGLSVFIFSLIIKFSSLLISLDTFFWAKTSGTLLIILGLVNLFPSLWINLTTKLKIVDKSEKNLAKSYQNNSWLEPILTGFALGPVFSSCSPIYLFIISVLLPKSLLTGTINLLAYCLGLSLVLLLLALAGQKLIVKLKWLANPRGWFKIILSLIFIIAGLLIFTGTDKKIEAWVLNNNNWLKNYINLEQKLLPKS